MAFGLRDALRWMAGGDAKEKSVFASEKEAHDFLLNLYRESGGVSPELRKAYEFHKKHFDDGCEPNVQPSGSNHNCAVG